MLQELVLTKFARLYNTFGCPNGWGKRRKNCIYVSAFVSWTSKRSGIEERWKIPAVRCVKFPEVTKLL